MNINSVCVYCASSSKIDQIYFDEAIKLGRLLVDNKLDCICGAGNQGLMGALTDSVIDNGGNMKGIIPRFMVEEGWHHQGITDLVTTETMHERKTLMAQLADAVVALPGGCGTMEELLEIITWKQLGLYFGPIVILNIRGYYDPLIKMLENAVSETFMRPEHSAMWSVASNAEEAVEQIIRSQSWHENPRDFAAI